MLVAAALLMAVVLSALARHKRDAVEQGRPRRASIQQGTFIEVHANGDFQGALNRAQCGDTIVLQAGARTRRVVVIKGLYFRRRIAAVT